MRYFFRRYAPGFSRVLLVESGSRHVLEKLLPSLYAVHGERMVLDLVTCYPGAPSGFLAQRGSIYRVTDFPNTATRKRLLAELAANKYSVLGIVCSGEPILTKWKWALAARLPSKVFVVNENSDHFWLHWGSWRTITRFILVRSGLKDPGATRALARVLLFPFTLLYLLLYAAVVHLRRKVRTL